MILKKPYAFLIKHFRMIHLLLLIPIGYLISKTSAIVSFFRNYVSNNYTTSMVNIASNHINFYMYLAILFILFSVLAIYYLMRQKRKSTKLYFFILLYYIALFILIGLSYSILSNLEHTIINAQVARAYRDISVVFIMPQYFFFLYLLFRGIGFDIKKFNFANDLKDLEITDIDTEEFEVSITIESYKISRSFRKFLREMRYYFLENKFVFSCLFVIFFIFIGTTVYLHFGVYNRTYHVSDTMTHNYFNLQIKDSILTNLDFSGTLLKNNKYYLVLQIFVENKTNKDYELDYTNFRLLINGQYTYPVLDRGEYFLDLGKPYIKEKIKSHSKDYYVLAYEIEEKELKDSYTLKILEGIDYKVGEIAAKYKNVRLNPKLINKIEELGMYTNDKIANLKESNLGYTTLKINKYTIANNYSYFYSYCPNENNCRQVMDQITPDISGAIEKTTLLILDTEYNLDLTTKYANSIKSSNKFFDHFFSIRYEKEGKTYFSNVKNRTTLQMNNTIVFEANENIKDADKIELLLTNRDKRYIFQLK